MASSESKKNDQAIRASTFLRTASSSTLGNCGRLDASLGSLLLNRSRALTPAVREAAKSAGFGLFVASGPPPITREGAIAGGLGTLFAFFLVMVMFKLAPERQAESRFWRSINQLAPPNFARRWPWWVGAGIVAWLAAQAFFQFVVIR